MVAVREKGASLARIASALGLPESAFFDETAPDALVKRAELLRLWDAIPDDAGRERLLTLARELAAPPAKPEKLAAE